MSFDAHANFAGSFVAVAPSPAASGTSLTVSTGQGVLFPDAPFNATIWPGTSGATPNGSNAEIVRVTNVSGDVLTIERAQEDTSARTIVAGDRIAATITKKTLTDIEEAVSAIQSSVEPSSAQFNTLSNALSVEAVARATVDGALSAAVTVVSNALSIETADRHSASAALEAHIDAVSAAGGGGTGSVTSHEVSVLVQTASLAATSADAHANTVSARVVSASAELVSLIQIASAAATSADGHAQAASAAAIANDASVSAVIKADIGSVSAAIRADEASHIASTSAVIKADIASVSAVLAGSIQTASAAATSADAHANTVSARLVSASAELVSLVQIASAAATSADAHAQAASAAAIANDASVSAAIIADVASHLASTSATIKADINSVSAAIRADEASHIASTSATIKTDINSVSAAIMADVASHLASTSATIKADINSVSAAIMADAASHLASTSATIKADIASVSAVIKADIASVSAVLATSVQTASAAAIANDASVSAAIISTVGAPQFKMVTGAQAVATNAQTKVSGLSLSLVGNGVYEVFGQINWTQSGGGSATAIMGFGMSCSAAPVYAAIRCMGNQGAYLATTTISTAALQNVMITFGGESALSANTTTPLYAAKVSTASGGQNGAAMMIFDGIVQANASQSQLKCWVLCSSGTGFGINVRVGSYIRAFRIG